MQNLASANCGPGRGQRLEENWAVENLVKKISVKNLVKENFALENLGNWAENKRTCRVYRWNGEPEKENLGDLEALCQESNFWQEEEFGIYWVKSGDDHQTRQPGTCAGDDSITLFMETELWKQVKAAKSVSQSAAFFYHFFWSLFLMVCMLSRNATICPLSLSLSLSLFRFWIPDHEQSGEFCCFTLFIYWEFSN